MLQNNIRASAKVRPSLGRCDGSGRANAVGKTTPVD